MKLEEEFPSDPDPKGEKLNPWLTIWYAPRATIRSAINYRNSKLLVFLAIIYGIARTFVFAINREFGEQMSLWLILLFILVIGTISGVIFWYIYSAINYYVGKIFHGKGTFDEMCTAMAIAFVPHAVIVILYVLGVVFLGEKLFYDATLSTIQTGWHSFSACFAFVLLYWSIFLAIKGIAEVHQFSSWIGLFTISLPVIIVVSVGGIIWIFILLLTLGFLIFK